MTRPEKRKIRVGINPLTWTNDDMPELGAETPLEVCLAEAREAGYEGVELGNKFPRTPEALRPILEAHDLALVSGWYSSNLLERSVEAEIEALEPHLRLLEALGSNVLVLCETTGAVHGDREAPLSSRPTLSELSEPAWKRLTEGLDRLGAHTKRRGIRLAYHHHMGTLVQTEAEIDRLLEGTGEDVFLLLDTGHLTYAGGRPADVASRHGRRVAHVHAKDIRPSILSEVLAADLPFLEAVLRGVFTVPGDGGVDYRAVFSALARAGYGGWVVVEAEQDPRVAHPLTYAKMGHEATAALLQEAGLLP